MRAKLKKKKLMLLWRSCRTGRRVEFSPKTEAGTPLTGRVTPGVLEAGNFAIVALLRVLKNTANLALMDLGTASGPPARRFPPCFGDALATSAPGQPGP